MTDDEIYSLLNGLGWVGFVQQDGYYVGNTPNITRLDVPSIKMQDAAQGFRTSDERMIGEVTSWPCCLAAAATFDTKLVHTWATAMGAEFAAKGSNILLGPSVNVHRVARGGRNAEYISGESPFLGAAMVREYVTGVQSNAVSAVVKHYAFNNQETNRMTVDVHVDERTSFEVYFPPFQAAVEAGVGAAMCAYNLVNGSHACANPQLLDVDFKRRMGFAGFVMSDWWAIHATGYENAGLDMDMPGNDGFFSPANLSSSTSSERLHNMAQRVIGTLISTGVWERERARPTCNPPACDQQLYADSAVQAFPDHAALARTLAAQSIILLKNDAPDRRRRDGSGGGGSGNSTSPADDGRDGAALLPLRRGARLAVLGSACDAANNITAMLDDPFLGNYYTIGGSGRVIAPHPVSILQGLSEAGLWDIAALSLSDDPAAALAAVAAAGGSRSFDAVLLCGATSTTEGQDRANLLLDQDAFLRAVLGALPEDAPTVVLATGPGSVVLPWAPRATALALMFMGGQESGHAWADVLAGGSSPSARLPVTIPLREDDMVAPCETNPCVYSEELMVGWRALEGKPVAFPFGHGLSYTSFRHAWATEGAADGGAVVVAEEGPAAGGAQGRGRGCPLAADGTPGLVCMTVEVRNVGRASGREVVQLYLGLPAEYNEPPKVLKGFAKTRTLNPGGHSHDAQEVEFSLGARDLSVWDVVAGDWRRARGAFRVYIGKSSRDITLNASFSL